ncbi:pilus assembly PilX N-terminal domain-containing protein [Puniceicoccaceae bacterium K14]|nr:pilus assembly PilX N-terminal domain-containing protein [Puniceicoccaceae bacterium K14]
MFLYKKTTYNKKEGSTLIVSVLILTLLGAIYASIITTGMTERRMNIRHEARLEAQAAAESLVEYGFAQLQHHFSQETNLNASLFDTNGSDSLNLPPDSYFGSRVDTNSLEIVGGVITTNSANTYIDPSDPLNTNDPMKGKRVTTKEVTVYGKASVTPYNGANPITSYVSQTFEVRDSPLFTHAIFYNLDLDIHPGPRMDIHGPVHTNGKLRLNASSGLYFHDQVTTAEGLYHEYEHVSTKSWGDIYFKDSTGNFKSMKNTHTSDLNEVLDSSYNIEGAFLDSDLGDDFRATASLLWEGNLMTSLHGVSNYQPVQFSEYKRDDSSTSDYDPINTGHDLIEPLDSSNSNTSIESQKMAGKAGLYFKWDTSTGTLDAYDGDGNSLGISDLENTLWTRTEEAFQDNRRNIAVDVIDIHTGVLKQLIESPGTATDEKITDYDPSNDWNGIVYFECYSSSGSSTLDDSGVRLTGGELDVTGEGIPSLGNDAGMTFVTNNALYVKGHFNTDGNVDGDSGTYSDNSDEVPVAVMADSVTFLSASWDDTNSFSGMQNASSTEVSLAVVSGITPNDMTRDGVYNKYNGGAHNFPRYLEDWTGSTFAIRGSLVCLYESEIDWSQWECCSDFYSPPTRLYGFHEMFENGTYPPGTPMIRSYKRAFYTKMNASEYEAAIPWTSP